jgi:hypothetical protein
VNPSHIAFLSYARNDDAHERGRLSELRELLSGEVAAQSGDPFEIFQDKEDISWGQQWQERIKQSLDSVTFLIPILTPRFFRSEACRDELEQFLKRERELKRGDLIMPLYYIDTPILNDQIKRTNDALASVIYSRQYWDWRKLRFESLDSKQVRETIAKMGKGILAALERSSITKPVYGSELRAQSTETNEPFKEATATVSPAFYFPRNSTIAVFGNPGEQEYQFDGEKAIYIRLFPKWRNDQPNVGRIGLKNLFSRSRIVKPVSTVIGGIVAANKDGWITIDPAGNNTTKGITQGFPTGELWGISSGVFAPAAIRRLFGPREREPTIAIIRAEILYIRTLENYVETATSELKLKLPFIVEFGAVGLKDVFMAVPHPQIGTFHHGPFHEEVLVRRHELHDVKHELLYEVLRRFLEELYDLAGCVRSDVVTNELSKQYKIPPPT